jgi:hypothetical protein
LPHRAIEWADFYNFVQLCAFVFVAVGMWATHLRCPHVHSDTALSCC